MCVCVRFCLGGSSPSDEMSEKPRSRACVGKDPTAAVKRNPYRKINANIPPTLGGGATLSQLTFLRKIGSNIPQQQKKRLDTLY